MTSHCGADELPASPRAAPPPYSLSRRSTQDSCPPPYEMRSSLKPRRKSGAVLSSDVAEKWRVKAVDEIGAYYYSSKAKETDEEDLDSDDELLDPERLARVREAGKKRRMSQYLAAAISALVLLAYFAYSYLYRPYQNETAAIAASVLSPPTSGMHSHMHPEFGHLTLISNLDSKHVPGSRAHHRKGRLIVVGDVHGMLSSLKHLLAKLDFDRHVDHLVFAGDMISKGPDSVGVIQLAMDLGATGVRGNHEDRVLLAYRNYKGGNVDLVPPTAKEGLAEIQNNDHHIALSNMNEFSHSGEYKDRLLAKQFSAAQIRWLEACPVILRVGAVQGMGEVLVVHGGLVPGLGLEKQDPWMVMNMRSIHLGTWVPSDGRGNGNGGKPIDKKRGRSVDWFKLWNKYQKHKIDMALADAGAAGDVEAERMKATTVIYGHDSKRGLQVTDWTRGIDTGCLKGGKLTAVVLEVGKRGKVKESIVHVKCKDGRGR